MQMDTILPGGCSKGELTRHGQMQSRNLGKWLRDRYVSDLGLIPETFQVSPHMPLPGLRPAVCQMQLRQTSQCVLHH